MYGYETAPQTVLLMHARDQCGERRLVCCAWKHVDDESPCADAPRIVTRREPVRRVLQAHVAQQLGDGWLQVLQLPLLRRRAGELQELAHIMTLRAAHEGGRLSPRDGCGKCAAAYECRRSGESGGEVRMVVELEVQTAVRGLREHMAESMRQLWQPCTHHRERSCTVCR